MHLIIHRGSHNIGGSCVEVRSRGARIIIDIGMPLVDKDRKFNLRKYKHLSDPELVREGVLPAVPGLYDWDKGSAPIDAILISHSHLDHYGFLPYVNPDIPVYTSKGCKEILGVANHFGQSSYDPRTVRVVPPWEDFKVGEDMAVYPYLVDHSAPDAFAYLVKGEGKRVFYSGDLRGHGKKMKIHERFLKEPPQDVDLMVLEGTMVGQKREETKTEALIEEDLVKIFNERKQLIIFACSSQNIDRLTVLYNACLRTGRTLVMIPYTAYVLDRMKILSDLLPEAGKPQIRVFFEETTNTKRVESDPALVERLEKVRIREDEIAAAREKMVVMDSHYVRTLFEKMGLLEKALLVYSLWDGYRTEEGSFWKDHDIDLEKVHTSGHASLDELKEIVAAVKPKRIAPIHTQHPELFRDIFGDRVMDVTDGQVVTV